jgi:hypothetical protein
VDFPMRLYHKQIRDEMFQFAKAAEIGSELESFKAAML